MRAMMQALQEDVDGQKSQMEDLKSAQKGLQKAIEKLCDESEPSPLEDQLEAWKEQQEAQRKDFKEEFEKRLRGEVKQVQEAHEAKQGLELKALQESLESLWASHDALDERLTQELQRAQNTTALMQSNFMASKAAQEEASTTREEELKSLQGLVAQGQNDYFKTLEERLSKLEVEQGASASKLQQDLLKFREEMVSEQLESVRPLQESFKAIQQSQSHLGDKLNQDLQALKEQLASGQHIRLLQETLGAVQETQSRLSDQLCQELEKMRGEMGQMRSECIGSAKAQDELVQNFHSDICEQIAALKALDLEDKLSDLDVVQQVVRELKDEIDVLWQNYRATGTA